MSAFTNRSCVSVADTVLSTPSGTVTPTRTTAESCAIDEIEAAQTMTIIVDKRRALITRLPATQRRAPLNRPIIPRANPFWDRPLSQLVGYPLAAHDHRK